MSRGDRSRPARERTAEERERDREERERRRAGRSAEPAAAPAEPAAEATTPPARAAPASPPPAPAPARESAARAAPVEPAAAPAREAPAPTAPRAQPASEPPREAPVAAEPPAAQSEAPSAPPPPPPPPPPLPPPRSEPVAAVAPGAIGTRSAGRSLLARLAAVVALLAVVAVVFLLFRALFSTSHAKAPPPPAVVKVVIPEGKTRAQIAQIAAAAGLSGSYLAASRRSPLLNPAHYGAPAGTPNLEGFLFPATYDENPGEPVSRLVEQQLGAFQENFGVAEISRARALHVTPYQLLTIASMVEREAQIPGDRAKIAAVIYNRLKAGMPLGIDATIYYAVELHDKIATYTHELTEAQLKIDSPYNTRTHTGLPPTPISNPGVASIEAAAHPAHVPYLYYVAGADGCGEQVFSTTLAAFEANAAAYHAAVAANGGKPPSCKHR